MKSWKENTISVY